jgi:hypothetical protein
LLAGLRWLGSVAEARSASPHTSFRSLPIYLIHFYLYLVVPDTTMCIYPRIS